MFTIARILVAIDFSETSERALAFAIELARKVGASITVLHVYQIPIYGFPDGALIAGPEVAARLASAAQESLDATMARHRGCDVELTPMLREGVAWEEIGAAADEVKADMLVIGTHGRRGLARALLGSVAENVIRTVALPVLTIHGPRETA